MNTKISLSFAMAASLAFLPLAVTAQTYYQENFDVNNSANWTLNAAVNCSGNVSFDYSTVGLPSAPRSTPGTTTGLLLQANKYGGTATFGGISASPLGLDLSGYASYMVTYDFWENYNGNANGTGSGTTQLTGAGIGTSGTVAQHANSAQSSLWFAQTGDGGNSTTSKDYRAYSSATGSGTGYTIASGIYAAGTGTTAADNLNALYAPLGANTVPAAQTAITATQLGTTPAGAPGFKWHTGQIIKNGNTVTYSIDGVLIATVDATTLTLGGGNIEFIQSDINSGVSTDPTSLTYEFGLFDNIVVSPIPEPTTLALGLLGVAGLALARRRNK